MYAQEWQRARAQLKMGRWRGGREFSGGSLVWHAADPGSAREEHRAERTYICRETDYEVRPEYLLQGCKRYNCSCSLVSQVTPLSVVCD